MKVMEAGSETVGGTRPEAGSEAPVVAGWAHPLLGAVDGACGRVDAAGETATWGLSDADLESAVAGCERLRAKTHRLELGLIAEADQRGLPPRLGAASTAAWLRHRFRIRPGHAKSLVHTANAVTDPGEETLDHTAHVSRRSGRELRETGAALTEGAISPEHAATVDRVMTRVPREIDAAQAAQAESDLAGFCREFDPGTVAKLGDYMLEMMRTDALDDEDEHRHRNRTLQLDEHTGGISGQLTRDGLALLRTALDPLAAPNPGSDGEPDRRTPGQRLADALVELARRALASDEFATNHGISHRVMVSIGLDSLTGGNDGSREPGGSDHAGGSQDTPGAANISNEPAGDSGHNTPADGAGAGSRASYRPQPNPLPGWATHRDRGAGVAPAQLAWGSFIGASTALRLTCQASVQRIVLDPAGAVLDVGRERRTVTPAQFAALIARDGGCAFPGCTRPPVWCIAHHIRHWAHGGPTDLDNLVMLCGHHHRVIHHDGWAVHIDSHDRLPTFTAPRWIDPDRRPRRNNRPRSPGTSDRSPTSS